MNRALAYAILGGVLFVFFALAALPARLVFDAAAGPAGLRAGLVQGSVWDAQILRLSAGGPPITEIRAGLRPASLLVGAARFDVSVRDATLRGEGVLALRPSGAALEAFTGVAALSRFPLIAGLPEGQSVQVDIERLAVDAQGRCREADGTVRTGALAAAGEPFGAALPVLEGGLLCAGEAIAVQLDGRSEAIELSGRIRFEPDGPSWRVSARTRDRDVVAALSVIGFLQTGPGAFELDSQRLEEEE